MPDARTFTVTTTAGETVEVEEGRRLVLGLEDGGVDILHRCGGNARCATCRVEVVDGNPTEVTPWEDERLGRLSDRQATTRLGCQIRVCDDLTVDVKNRLHAMPDMDDPGPRIVEWPADRALEPEP